MQRYKYFCVEGRIGDCEMLSDESLLIRSGTGTDNITGLILPFLLLNNPVGSQDVELTRLKGR